MDIRPVDEFVHFIVLNGHTADLLNEHVRKLEGDTCASCGKIWPCNMRRVAERALRWVGFVGPIRSRSTANTSSNYVIS